MRLALKVQPKASENAVVGWENGTLKVRVTAPPERGKANDAVRSFPYQLLDVAERYVAFDNIAAHQGRVTRGEIRRHTVALLEAVDVDVVYGAHREAPGRTHLTRPLLAAAASRITMHHHFDRACAGSFARG